MSLIFLSDFVIPQQVVPQLRPRAAHVAGHTMVYDVHKCKTFRNLVAVIAQQFWRQPIIQSQPVHLEIEFYLSIPKSTSKKNMKLMLEDRLLPTKKPDLDNAAKGVIDGMTGIVWHDDSQIASLYVRKFYDTQPCTKVKVYRIDPDQTTNRDDVFVEDKEKNNETI